MEDQEMQLKVKRGIRVHADSCFITFNLHNRAY